MSEKIEVRAADRSGWDVGPWDGEPDHWEDRHLGFPVLALRNPSAGNWCGYVGVPPGHPWYDKDEYSEIDASVHGGLTYSGRCNGHICHVARPGEPEAVYWVGFDCHHAGDYAPSNARYAKESQMPGIWEQGDDEYRTLEYVQAECRRLAEQAQAACEEGL